ncbi:MAG: zf-HC2 domain-containing protein, partial [Actinomycetota bacterium]
SAQRVLELEKQEARLRTELQGLTSRIVATEPGSVEERADLPATDDSDCAHVLALVQDFLDGELPGDQRALVTTHLESCGHCLEVYDVEAELAITIRKIGDRVHSSALRERLRRVEAALAQPWTEA